MIYSYWLKERILQFLANKFTQLGVQYTQEPRFNGLDAGKGGYGFKPLQTIESVSKYQHLPQARYRRFTQYFTRVTREQFIMAAIGHLITNQSRSEVESSRGPSKCGKGRRYAYATALGSLVVLQSSMVNLKGNNSQIEISSPDFWKMLF